MIVVKSAFVNSELMICLLNRLRLLYFLYVVKELGAEGVLMIAKGKQWL